MSEESRFFPFLSLFGCVSSESEESPLGVVTNLDICGAVEEGTPLFLFQSAVGVVAEDFILRVIG
jgi:hypothetical protein